MQQSIKSEREIKIAEYYLEHTLERERETKIFLAVDENTTSFDPVKGEQRVSYFLKLSSTESFQRGNERVHIRCTKPFVLTRGNVIIEAPLWIWPGLTCVENERR
ncbi:unnamed protein product [Lasius platythorax]|uniref:Uncharacterized protein n=1 Tax=Lasius platythorax TaxID=488582 RepID=A0AAV2N082_9HYME